MQKMKRRAAALAGEQRYSMLVESVTDYAIYMLDIDGVIVSWNPGAQRFKGYVADEIIGAHFSRFYTAEDQARQMPRRALDTTAKEGRFEDEGWRVRKDGTRFWASVVIDPVRDKDGVLIGFAKVTRDLTERKLAAETLQRSEEQFRLLVQSVTDYSIFLLDPGGFITSWNLGAQRIKGYLPHEIIGAHVSRFYTDIDRLNGLPQWALDTAAREGRCEQEAWRVRRDGTRFWANVIIDPIRAPDGRLIGFTKITRDITERMEAQKALDETRQALFQAQKMEAIGQLTGGIAHDFNNLLGGIIGSLQLLETRIGQGRYAELGRYLDSAKLCATRATSLTQRLLAYARQQMLDPKTTDISQLAAGMDDLVRQTVGAGIEVTPALAADIWLALVDPCQLENALLNLCINARDAMPDGGTLGITTANHQLNEESAALLDVAPGQYVVLCVKDSGTGMTPDVIARAYDPFFTTKPLGEGTGLGLSMVYGFMRQSNGVARIVSAPGAGTTVSLYLPRAPGQLPSGLPPGPAAVVPVPDRKTLRGADDSFTVRMTFEEVLEDLAAGA